MAMTLDQFLTELELSNAGFAEQIGVTRMAVMRYREGSRMPEPEIAARIVDATEGKVRIEDLHRSHIVWRSVRTPVSESAA